MIARLLLIFGLIAVPAAVRAERCLSFDGTDDVVNCGNVNSLRSASRLTVEMWVRIDRFGAWKTFFSAGTDQAHRVQFQQYSAPGRLGVVVNNGERAKVNKFDGYYYTRDQVVTIGDWFHLAMVYDGISDAKERLKVYINGSQRVLAKHDPEASDAPAALPSVDAPVLLGAETPGGKYGYKGLMDEVRIWSTARTEAQIRASMEQELSGTEPGLLMYYRFEPDSGVQSKEALRVLRDFSPNRRNGDLKNFALQGTVSNWVDRQVKEPAVQSSGITVLMRDCDRLQIRWNRGSGVSNAVFIAAAGKDAAVPVDGNSYKGDSAFGKGSPIGRSGWSCVYSGNGNTVLITGLTAGTLYTIHVCDFNGTSGQENYKADTSAGNPLTASTKKAQRVTIAPIPQRKVGDSVFDLKVTTTSELPVVFSSSDTAVASIEKGIVHCRTAGEAVITATQLGDSVYGEAQAKVVVKVAPPERKRQTISFSLGKDTVKRASDPPFPLHASASSLLPVTIVSSDTAIAAVRAGNCLALKNPGVAVLRAFQLGNPVFAPSDTVEALLTVTNNEAPPKIKSRLGNTKRGVFLYAAGGAACVALVTTILMLHGGDHGLDTGPHAAVLPNGPPSDP